MKRSTGWWLGCGAVLGSGLLLLGGWWVSINLPENQRVSRELEAQLDYLSRPLSRRVTTAANTDPTAP